MDKSRFRTLALRRLRSIPRMRSRLYDKRVITLLKHRIDELDPKSVMLYIPLDMEVDVRPLIRLLRRRGVSVYVPFMEGESFRLVQYRLPLKIKKYGVQEPFFSKKYRTSMIDIAIVPIIATDASWRRIGFGKGMYDLFFARERQRIGYTIFVQRILQQCKDTITDEWDIRADEVITAA